MSAALPEIPASAEIRRRKLRGASSSPSSKACDAIRRRACRARPSRFKARGILYLPDFLVNAGGIISVAREYLGTGNDADVMAEVGLIAGRVAELFERMHAGTSPSRVAEHWAREKLGVA
jgi:hypothetical protein